ncbi:hypothetical protein [Roseateles sp. P5_E11]
MSQDIAEQRFAELEAISTEYAQAQALAEHLAEFRKSKKAQLMREAEVSGNKSSAAIQEREAYAHPDYIALLKGLQAATEKALALKWRLEITRMKFEWARTKAANRRAEMSLR